MDLIPVIAIFDIGKTNKKFFLFDESYEVVYEKSTKLPEITDEDGFPCDDIKGIEQFVTHSLREISQMRDFDLKAVSFTAYGASFVYIDDKGKPLTPLYNYLKPYPDELKAAFYSKYGGEEYFSMIAASPFLGSLNSGMQLYRFKYEQPQLFAQLKYALHLPQYLSFLVSGQAFSDITSVGCHTNLWDFSKGQYHEWLDKESVMEKLAPLRASDHTTAVSLEGEQIMVGVGLHDSSSALIPYFINYSTSFALISTGTWCITLNPFNNSPLTTEKLASDCLCYLSYFGKPVKASRLFSGYEHEQQVAKIAAHFIVDPDFYKTLQFDQKVLDAVRLKNSINEGFSNKKKSSHSDFIEFSPIESFENSTEAYYQVMIDLVTAQVKSSLLVLEGTEVNRIFVDGGFSRSSIFMNLLSIAMPTMEIYAASMSEATALGAALAIHASWNRATFPADLIELRKYSIAQSS